jgi:hypothetical protein
MGTAIGIQDIVTLRTYEDMQRKVSNWADGTYSHLMIIGRPGILKSSTIKAHARDLKFPIIRGAATARGLFDALAKEVRGAAMACFDDLSIDVFADQRGLAVARDATESDEPREIGWAKHPEPDVIRNFNTRLCFLTNGFGQVSARVARQFAAFTDRLRVYFFEPPNQALVVRAHALGIGTLVSNQYIESLLREVAEYTLSARKILYAGVD